MGRFTLGMVASALTLSLVLPVAHAQDDVEVLRTSVAGFPTVRAYVGVPDQSWAASAVEVAFTDQLTPAQLEAVEGLRACLSAGEDCEYDLTNAPPLMDLPASSVPARVTTYEDQQDTSEGLLVVFLVDASSSMDEAIGGTDVSPMDEARQLIIALVGALRPIDRVAVVRFGDDVDILVAPTLDHEGALSAVIDTYPGEVRGMLYDAVVDTLQSVLQQSAEPNLPGRRLLFVFSDGQDVGSTHPVEDVSSIWGNLSYRPTLVTIGVGDIDEDADRHRDLERIAAFAGSGENFLQTPTSRQMTASFSRLLEPIRAQLMIELEVPIYYWATPPVATLSIQPPSAARISTPINIPISMSGAQDTQQQEYRAAIQAIASWWVEVNRPAPMWRIYAAAGGGAFLLLALTVVVALRRGKRREASRRSELHELKRGIRKDAGDLEQARETARTEERRAADISRAPLAVLMALGGPLKGERFGILKPQCVAGRDADKCDLVFPNNAGDPSISRIHVRFTLGAGTWTATCLSDGAFTINGQQLHNGEQYPLSFGDQLVIGKSMFQFEQP